MANPRLKDSDINHLRRLLGYVRCEIGQSPEEFMETMRKIAPVCGEPDDGGKQRLVESYQKAERVPKYVRAAVKALEKFIRDEEGEVFDMPMETFDAIAKEVGTLKAERIVELLASPPTPSEKP